MSILTRRNDPNLALETFDLMKVRGIEPDLITYNTAIGACSKAGNIDRAFELYETLRSQGLK